VNNPACRPFWAQSANPRGCTYMFISVISRKMGGAAGNFRGDVRAMKMERVINTVVRREKRAFRRMREACIFGCLGCF